MKSDRVVKVTFGLSEAEVVRTRLMASLRGCVFSPRSRREVPGNVSRYVRMLLEQDYAKYQAEGG